MSELPESQYQRHPLLEALCKFLPFSQLGSVVSTNRKRHINLGELTAALRLQDRSGRAGVSYTVLIRKLQVATARLVKGRSASPALNGELHFVVPSHRGQKTQPRFGFIRSRFHPSDDPTKNYRSFESLAWQFVFGLLVARHRLHLPLRRWLQAGDTAARP